MVWVQAQAWVELSSKARQLTLTVPLSSQECEWVATSKLSGENGSKMPGGNQFHGLHIPVISIIIRETAWAMNERMEEHEIDIRLARTQNSAVSEHANKTGRVPPEA